MSCVGRSVRATCDFFVGGAIIYRGAIGRINNYGLVDFEDREGVRRVDWCMRLLSPLEELALVEETKI